MGFLDLALRRRHLERDEVIALEEADEIGRADDEAAFENLHAGRMLPAARDS